MRLISNSLEDIGVAMLMYGDPGVGKTYGAGSAPDPQLWVITEPRDPKNVLQELMKQGKQMTFIEQEGRNIDEILDYLNSQSELCGAVKRGEAAPEEFPYKTVILDSASFAHSQHKLFLEDTVEEDKRVEAMAEKNVQKRALLMPQPHERSNIEWGGWGAMGSEMTRLTDIINSFSKQHGLNVILTAWVGDNPKKGDEIKGHPMFLGRIYGAVMAGYFDLIVRLFPNPKTNKGYPPVMCFQDLQTKEQKAYLGGSSILPGFLAKAANPYIAQQPFQVLDDMSRIIDVVRGKSDAAKGGFGHWEPKEDAVVSNQSDK